MGGSAGLRVRPASDRIGSRLGPPGESAGQSARLGRAAQDQKSHLSPCKELPGERAIERSWRWLSIIGIGEDGCERTVCCRTQR